MYLMRNHDVWIYVRCANSDPRIAFDRLYDLIDEAAGHGFLVRGTSFDHCSGNTLKDRIGLRSMLDAVENGRIEAVMVRDLEQISRNSYILVGVIEILRQNDVYLITTECDLNAELINSGLERFVGDRFTRASFGKPRFDVRLPLIWYDWEHSLPFQDFGDSTQCFLLRIRLSCSHPAVKALLADWRIHRTAFENGRITSSDYLEWMLQWPPTLSAPDD